MAAGKGSFWGVSCGLLGVLLLGTANLAGQSLSQIGFKVKQMWPEVGSFAVVCSQSEREQVENQAKTATLITRKKVLVFAVGYMGDLNQRLASIQAMNHPAVIVVANEQFMKGEIVQYLSEKMSKAGIPVISTRLKDTFQGAALTMAMEGDNLVVHGNMLALSMAKVNLSEEQKKGVHFDVE